MRTFALSCTILCTILVVPPQTSVFAARLAAPVVVSPGAPTAIALVESRCPTFSWGGVEGAARYELVVHRLDDPASYAAASGAPLDLEWLEPSAEPVLAREVPGAAHSFTPSLELCLEPGVRYAWMLRARDDADGAGPWSEPGMLEVAAEPSSGPAAARTGRGTEGARLAAEDLLLVQTALDRARSAESPGDGAAGSVRVGAASAPVPQSPSLRLSGQLHLAAEGAVFKQGDLFLWDEVREVGTAGVFKGSTALGRGALASNTTGDPLSSQGTSNTALGYRALTANTTGSGNTATGNRALQSNTTGAGNTASGIDALRSNQTGSGNAAFGSNALESNTEGAGNTAVGELSLLVNESGSLNVAVGGLALLVNRTGSSNVAIGYAAGSSIRGSNNITIASAGKSEDQNTLRIGDGTGTGTRKLDRVFIQGIRGRSVESGLPVVVGSDGKLGTPGCGSYQPAAVCPLGANGDGPSCDKVPLGSFCETDGECSLDAALDNCGGADWYFRVQ
jgi:hypothetical protein